MARSRSSTALTRLLNGAAAPVYVVGDDGEIIYCNASCTHWLGVESDDLIVGLRCRYHSNTDVSPADQLAAGLCPPPETRAGQRARAVVTCRRIDGAMTRRAAEFLPLAAAEGRFAVIVVVEEKELAAPPKPTGDPSPHELHDAIRWFRQRAAKAYGLDRLVGASPMMQRLREQVALARLRCGPALIVGPPGSGRRHIAQTIHYREEGGGAGPLTPVDCAIMDSELIQSTFTAFLRRQRELGDDHAGTLLLLKIDSLQSDAQQELIGLLNLPDLGLRFLATSQRPLIGESAPEGFRKDLAYALSALVIEAPPLSERAEDIPLLVQMFVEDFNAANDRQLAGFSHDALDQLAGLSWPDNLDDLAACVEQACQQAVGPLVQANDLPDEVRIARTAAMHPRREPERIDLDQFLGQIERELFQRAMATAKGNKSQAARLLGITTARLRRRLEQLGLGDDAKT